MVFATAVRYRLDEDNMRHRAEQDEAAEEQRAALERALADECQRERAYGEPILMNGDSISADLTGVNPTTVYGLTFGLYNESLADPCRVHSTRY